MVDARVAALAHRRALVDGEPGRRYALVGPYLAFAELARLVRRVAGWPKVVWPMPDFFEGPLTWAAGGIDRHRGRSAHRGVSRAAVAGGFLRLHVRGDLADSTFGLVHPHPLYSIRDALEDAKRAGLAGGIRLRESAGLLADQMGGNPSTP